MPKGPKPDLWVFQPPRRPIPPDAVGAFDSEDRDMGKIADVTAFMKNDVADMNAQAEELHKTAMAVKEHFNVVTGAAKEQLTQAQKDLMELQAAMGLSSNFPPS